MGINEQTVRADDWMNYGSDVTNGNSSNCMNEGELGSAARIIHDAVQEPISNEGLGIDSDPNAISTATKVDASNNDSVYEDELTTNDLNE